MRYYSTQRPVGPGTFPKTQRVVEVVNFDRREMIEEIGRPAWGYVEYEAPITEREAENFELVGPGKGPSRKGGHYDTA